MVAVYLISLAGVVGAVSAFQYRAYKKSHPNGSEGQCNCKP